MEKFPILIGCKSVDNFFTRFGANDSQREKYNPIFLVITQSYSGEVAPSFGIFEKGNQLYTVYGSECSVWDFNGQFQPELTTIDLLMLEVKKEIGKIDGEDRFNTKLLECVKSLEQSDKFKKLSENMLVREYVDYIGSFEVTNIYKYAHFFIGPRELDVFKSNLVKIEDEIEFYKFKIKSEWDEDLTLFLKSDGSLHCGEIKNRSYVKPETGCIKKFISDILGCIEMKTNIFEEASMTFDSENQKGNIIKSDDNNLKKVIKPN